MSPTVLVTLFPARSDNIRRDVAVLTQLVESLECLLHDTVLTGMEGQNCSPSSRCERTWQLLHEFVQHLILMIDIDTQCLEYPGTAFLDQLIPGRFLLLRAVANPLLYLRRQFHPLQGLCYYFMQLPGRLDRLPLLRIHDLLSDRIRIRLIGILNQHADQ